MAPQHGAPGGAAPRLYPGPRRLRPQPAQYRFSLERTVECLASWMQALGLPCTDLRGHSMGGQVCLRLAAAHPDRVRKLVPADASGLPLHAHLLPLSWRSMRSQGHTRFRFAPIALATALLAGPLVLWGALHDLPADDVQTLLSGIVVPELLAWGGRDNVMFECPEPFNRPVLDFPAE